MRQLITESLLLGVTGGAFDVALAYWSSSSSLALMGYGRSPVTLHVHPDLTVLVFALGVSLLTVLVFGTLPAWRATHVDLAPAGCKRRTASPVQEIAIDSARHLSFFR